MLCHMLCIRSSQTNDSSASCIYNINTNNHCLLDVLTNINFIKIAACLCINLFQNIRVDGYFCSINSTSKNKLWGNTILVQKLFYSLFVSRITYYHNNKLKVSEWETITMSNIAFAISFTSIICSYFDVFRIFNFDSEWLASLLHSIDTLICLIVIVFRIHKAPPLFLQIGWFGMLDFSIGVIFPITSSLSVP